MSHPFASITSAVRNMSAPQPPSHKLNMGSSSDYIGQSKHAFKKRWSLPHPASETDLPLRATLAEKESRSTQIKGVRNSIDGLTAMLQEISTERNIMSNMSTDSLAQSRRRSISSIPPPETENPSPMLDTRFVHKKSKSDAYPSQDASQDLSAPYSEPYSSLLNDSRRDLQTTNYYASGDSTSSLQSIVKTPTLQTRNNSQFSLVPQSVLKRQASGKLSPSSSISIRSEGSRIETKGIPRDRLQSPAAVNAANTAAAANAAAIAAANAVNAAVNANINSNSNPNLGINTGTRVVSAPDPVQPANSFVQRKPVSTSFNDSQGQGTHSNNSNSSLPSIPDSEPPIQSNPSSSSSSLPDQSFQSVMSSRTQLEQLNQQIPPLPDLPSEANHNPVPNPMNPASVPSLSPPTAGQGLASDTGNGINGEILLSPPTSSDSTKVDTSALRDSEVDQTQPDSSENDASVYVSRVTSSYLNNNIPPRSPGRPDAMTRLRMLLNEDMENSANMLRREQLLETRRRSAIPMNGDLMNDAANPNGSMAVGPLGTRAARQRYHQESVRRRNASDSGIMYNPATPLTPLTQGLSQPLNTPNAQVTSQPSVQPLDQSGMPLDQPSNQPLEHLGRPLGDSQPQLKPVFSQAFDVSPLNRAETSTASTKVSPQSLNSSLDPNLDPYPVSAFRDFSLPGPPRNSYIEKNGIQPRPVSRTAISDLSHVTEVSETAHGLDQDSQKRHHRRSTHHRDLERRLSKSRKRRSFTKEGVEELLVSKNAQYNLDEIDLPREERVLLDKFITSLSKLSIEIQMDESKREEGRRRLNNALKALDGWI